MREVDSGKVVYTDRDSMDVPVVTTACDGQLLVAFYDGSHLVKVMKWHWILKIEITCMITH